MKKFIPFQIAFFAFTLLAAGAWAAGNEILLDQLGSPHEDVHTQALQTFLNQGPSAIGLLVEQIGGENKIREKFAKRAVETMVNQSTRPGADNEREAVEKELVLVVLGKGTAEQQNFALSMLARAGDGCAVPAIAAHLYRVETQEMARYALENISCPSAAEALLKALPITVCPKFQAALIKTLGAKKYSPAYREILKATKSKDFEVSLTAIGALGRLADPQSLTPLFGIYMDSYGRSFWAAAEALLATADGLIEKGDPYRPRYIYMAFWQEMNPPWLRCAALRGYVKLDGKGAWDKLMLGINDADMMVRGTARDLLLGMPDERISVQLVNAVKHASGIARLELARLLAERKDFATGDAAPVLIDYLEENDPELKAAAKKALVQIPGEVVSRYVLAAVDVPQTTQRADLIRILGDRDYRGAILRLQQLAQRGDETLKPVAQEALDKLNR